MAKKMYVGIIGCGASGLVTLKELHEEGHTGTIFEKTSVIGGIFKEVYQQGYMVSSTVITLFSDFLGSEGDKVLTNPRMLSFVEYVKYLNEYADHFGLRHFVKFEHQVQLVERINPNSSDTKWRLHVLNLKTNEVEEHVFDRIVVCSGTHQHRYMPTLPNAENFNGVIKHMQDVRKFEEFAGKRMCVVGGGEAASDMALAAAKYGSRSFLSIRGDHGRVIPRYPFRNDIPADVLTTRAKTALPPGILGLNQTTRVYFTKFLLWLAGEGSGEEEQRQSKIRRQVFNMNRTLTKLRGYYSTFGTKNAGLAEAIACFGCQKKPGIRELREHSIIFHDGTEEEVDEIVCCTGFQNHFAFLDANMNDEGLQQVGKDARISHDLYKHSVHPLTGAGLFFIGFARPAFGAIPPLAEMQARWFALLCSNSRALPDRVAMVKDTNAYVQYLEYVYSNVRTDRITNLTDHLLFSDDIARSIGCRPDLGFRTLITDPIIWLRCMLGPLSITQYRLQGPHARPEQARQMIRKMAWCPDLLETFFDVFFLYFTFILWWITGKKKFLPMSWFSVHEWEPED